MINDKSIVHKFIVVIFVFSFISLSFTALPSGKSERPVIPHSVYGNIWINGRPAPDNVTIVAKIDGEERGNITTLEPAKFGSRNDLRYLDIRGYSDDQGKKVDFFIEGSKGDLIQASNVEPIINFTSKGFDKIDLYFEDVDMGDGLPEVNTDPAGKITQNSAELACNINYDKYSGGDISFYYREKGEEYWKNTTYESTSSSYYSLILDDLDPSKTYQFFPHYRLEGINETVGDGVCGVVEEFTTLTPDPTVKTLDPSEVTKHSALLRAEIDLSSYEEVDIAFFYRKSGGNWKDTGYDTVRTEDYSYKIKNLESGIVYEYYAKIKFDSKSDQGSTVQFKTVPTEPEVKTGEVEDIETRSATVNAEIDLGSHDSVDVMFFYRIKDEGWERTGFETVSSYSYSYDLINLKSNTTYEYYASILYGETVKHGSTKSFTTKREEPKINSITSTDVNSTSAKVVMDIAFNDYNSTEVKVHWEGDVYNESDWITRDTSGEYTYDIEGLKNDTLYECYITLRFDSTQVESTHIEFKTSSDGGSDPIAKFYISGDRTVDKEIVFDASPSEDEGEIVDYLWMIDEEQEMGGKTIGYTFTKAGYHTISLTIEDDEGNTNSLVKNFYIDDISPAKYRLTSFSISKSDPEPGDEITFSFRVSNTGGKKGTYETDFEIGNNVISNIEREVEPGDSKKITVSYRFNKEGDYDYKVGPFQGTIDVEEKSQNTDEIPFMLIFSIIIGVVAAVIIVFMLERSKKKEEEDEE